MSRYYLMFENALHRLNAHAINCTSTAGILKKMSFFFFFYFFYVSLNEGTNPRKFIHAVCPVFFPPPFFLFFNNFFFFFSSPSSFFPSGGKKFLRLRWRPLEINSKRKRRIRADVRVNVLYVYVYISVVIFILYLIFAIMYMLVHTGRYTRILLQREKLSWEICFLAFFDVKSVESLSLYRYVCANCKPL